MCGIYGVMTYGKNNVNVNKLMQVLAVEASVRGKHATGIAYNHANLLHIQKAAVPADKFVINLPKGITAVMGHTRHTTQGTEKDNFNNHPFRGSFKDFNFALAHNGVLDNDYDLQDEERLPKTEIKTDTYVAVQLIEKYDIKTMAEKVSGMFTFTVLTDTNVLIIVKNDSPIYFIDLPEHNMYVYGSTEEIVHKSLKALKLEKANRIQVHMKAGTIWTVYGDGSMDTQEFTVNESYASVYDYKSWNLKKAASGHYSQSAHANEWYEEDLQWRCYDAGIYEDEFLMMAEYFMLGDIEDALDGGTIFELLVEAYRAYHASKIKTVRAGTATS